MCMCMMLTYTIHMCAVCSITLWVGHLSKLATKETVKEAFEDFGQIKSIEVSHTNTILYIIFVIPLLY